MEVIKIKEKEGETMESFKSKRVKLESAEESDGAGASQDASATAPTTSAPSTSVGAGKKRPLLASVGGCQVQYRLCTSTILFKTETLLPLIQSSFPLRHADVRKRDSLRAVVGGNTGKPHSTRSFTGKF